MNLSNLQRYILLACDDAKGKRREHSGLEQFYESEKERPSEKDAQDSVTRSLERLIDKELLIGYGVRTSHKWYLKEIRLTPKGRKVVRELLEFRQTRLPLTMSRRRGRVDGG
ncbi:MAG: hypothetical protein HY208_07615 [Nitrospirae bacterium]|nr:hypothetical protein [Nitrospirota bacterium]